MKNETNNIQTNSEIISQIIEELRPFLNMEGGDIEFIKFDESDGTVFVRMFGACAMCMAQDETLEYGILESIKEKVPSAKKIINTPL